jgi:uncharacterized protein YecE (DUF72 family)
MRNVRVGTCSWADKTMVKAWYPPRVATAEARLRYYAARFGTVEADSPFYAIPTRQTTGLWAARTPPGFVFHVKAYGMMTGHAVDARTLPPELVDFRHATDARGRVLDPEPDMIDAAFDLFADSLSPLREAGKLGGVLLQFSARFTALDSEQMDDNLRYLDFCRGRLPDERLLVEFRHPSWVAEPRVRQVSEFLAARDMSFVSVDAPQVPGRATMPPIALATNGVGYVRLHGRNAETYFAQNATAAERFDYLYTAEELHEVENKVRELASETDVSYVMFNNCQRDFAPRNALQMSEILADVVEPVPVADGTPAAPGQEALF